MAEGGGKENSKNTLPQRGKVQQVRKEWSVFEDGAIAYQLQNEEIDRHYGMNRFNRRTVREDLPLAKIVQNDEEVQQQNERFEQLQALRAQAEEDERVAKELMEKEQLQVQAHRMAAELTDEEFAKAVQEKEKQKYERYLEKKKMKKLKKEKEEIEKRQQMMTEEARINVRGSQEDLDEQMSDMNLRQNGGPAMRVTTGGKIEDDGDFSDFYNLPENVDPAHRQAIQELQDEELAKLIQEQEHKRSKAEVDRLKLKEIEEQDKRLAEIMQEQEKLRLKKALAKKKHQEEVKRAQEAAQRPPALPPRNNHDHRRYRRNSFILSMENGPEGEEEEDNDFDPSQDYMTPVQAAGEQRLHSAGDQRLSSSRNSGNAGPNNARQVNSARENRQNAQNVKKVQNDLRYSRNEQRNMNPSQVPADSMPDVERWLASQPQAPRGRLRSDDSDHIPESPSPGSYHSDDAFPYAQGHPARAPVHDTSVDNSSHYAVSDPFNFNIATAIDPTYTRRGNSGNTDRKVPAHQVTNSLPAEEYPIGTNSSRGDSFHGDDSGIISPFVPVQGQRRAGDRARKSKKMEPASPTAKQKNNCKQQ